MYYERIIDTYLSEWASRSDHKPVLLRGARQVGKSTAVRHLGACFKTYVEINFEKQPEYKVLFQDNLDATRIVSQISAISGKAIKAGETLLFLDEIQNIDGWHLFVNRLLRQRMHILVTGSNAKLLSGELATHLTGRNDQIELYPFSFAEWCQCKGVDVDSKTTKAEALRRAAFDEYLNQGGFPELLYKKNKTRYIANLVDNILKRDIEQRHKIKYVEAFEQLTHHLLNIAPVTIVESDLASVVGLKSNHTINNYIGFLKDAYLLLGVKRFSTKSRQRVRAEKVYPVDVALMDSRPNAFAGVNIGWRLETVVYIELLRRNRPLDRDIYYYKSTSGYEADFVVCKNNIVEEVYQVSYDISKEKTRKRELRGLLSASKETRCDNLFLITDFHREDVTIEDKLIKIIPAYDWLIE